MSTFFILIHGADNALDTYFRFVDTNTTPILTRDTGAHDWYAITVEAKAASVESVNQWLGTRLDVADFHVERRP